MRYRLRTLLILLAILPPLLAVVWWGYGRWRERLERERKRLYWETLLTDHTWTVAELLEAVSK